MNDVFAVQVGKGDQNLSNNDSNFSLEQTAILGLDIREEISSCYKILKEVPVVSASAHEKAKMPTRCCP